MSYGATTFTNNGAGMFQQGAGNAYAPAGAGNGASYSNPTGNPGTGGGKGGAVGGPNGGKPAGGPAGPNVFDQSALALERATRGARGAMNYDPTMVNPASANISNAGLSTLGGSNLSQYMNPYQQSVIDTTMNGINQDQMMAQNNLDAQASAAGGFGGSRHGVAMGTQAGEYADTKAGTLAGLNSQNFQQAQQGAMFDAGMANNMSQFNTGQTNAGNQFNAGLNQQGQIANQNAGLAGAGLNLAGSAGLGNLSNLGFSQGMQINGQQATYGAQQQQLSQDIMDAAMAQWAGFTGAPAQSAGILAGGAGSVPYGTSGTNTTTSEPGLMDYYSLILGL